MNLKDQIQSADYIYSTYTKWGLKKYLCDIEYFKEENLGDLYYVICSILEAIATTIPTGSKNIISPSIKLKIFSNKLGSLYP